MGDPPFVARRLATAFLSGPWSSEEFVARGKLVLAGRRRLKWLPRLAAAVMARFGESSPRPRWRVLAEFLGQDRDVCRQPADPAAWPRSNLLELPKPVMAPAPRLVDAIHVPEITTEGDLATWLGLSPGELDWFADCAGHERTPLPGVLRHYRYRLLPKRSGRMRLLEIPKPRLKSLQTRILHEILDRITPHPAAHAFFPGRSIASYVARHSGRRVVLHVDLGDFFPSIRAARVNALLRTVGYPESVARLLTGLCTNSASLDAFCEGDRSAPAHLQGDSSPCETTGMHLAADTIHGVDASARALYRTPHLPQGAPTSPALANLCAYRLDVRLSGLAERFDAHYSRYADDLLFSGDEELERGVARFRCLVSAIALDEGFSICARKTRVMRRHAAQCVAGVILNVRPNLPRQDYDQLRALLFNCVRHGPASQNRDARPAFREHLQGRIAYFRMIHEPRGRKLFELFEQIDWGL